MNSSAISAVQLEQASKNFGSIQALRDVSFKVAPGEVVAVLGPNGAGKTTAISLMLGLRSPTTGSARIYGLDPRDPANRSRIGTMLQESDVPATLRVREVVELIGRYYSNPLSVAAALEMADLTDKAGAMGASLSGGQKKRLCFALAVIGNPDVLFLDEPTAALDVEARRGFWVQVSGFAAAGKTIILTTHYLEEADALAERIIVINRGEIVAQGTPEAIKARVGGKIVRFKTDATLETLSGLPSVTRSSLVSDTCELYTLEPERVLREVFARNLGIHDLEVKGGGLEEAFVEITNTTAQPSSTARANLEPGSGLKGETA
jgi:ABC-2 type transport system ATP-binding protein